MARSVLVSAIFMTALFASLRGGETPNAEKIDFLRVIKPLLESSCVKCHGQDRFHGDLRLDTKEFALNSFGDLGRLLTPGNPEKSTLYITSVLPDGDPLAMPLRDRDKLTKDQAEQLRLWIAQGADWPEGAGLKRINKIFFSQAANVLQTSCLKCHSAAGAAGGIRLDNRESAFKGGHNGPSIVRYDPDSSKLYRSLISPSVHDKNPPRLLFDEDIALLKEWIRQGAVWPDDMESIGPEPGDAKALPAPAKRQ